MKRLLLLAIGVGAAATYFFDPTLGEKRRKEMRKRLERVQKMGRKAKVQAGL